MQDEPAIRFTQLAETVWQRAKIEAAALYHPYIGTEHLLIALSRAEGGFTERLLARIDRQAYLLRAQLRSRAGMGSPARFERTRMELTPRLRSALAAVATAASGAPLDERALLLAILEGGPGLAMRVLAEDDTTAAELAAGLRADPGPEAKRLRHTGEDWPEEAARGDISGVSPRPAAAPAASMLATYGRDLVAEARAGKIRPIHGQRATWLRIGQALARAERNVPVLIGEPGVGKTAIVEGLAERISRSHERPVNKIFEGLRIIELRMGELVAGTDHRGEFEQRIQGILREAAAQRDQVVLFIDEIHTVVGAGSASGSLDAAQMLKPALARGDIRVIGATTPAEYERYIARDAALARRMERINVPEPSPEEARDLLRAMRPWYEERYQVTVTPEALDAAVDLSVRYLPEQFLPGKALDLIDRACAHGVVGDMFSINESALADLGAMSATGGTVDMVAVRVELASQLGLPLGDLTTNDRDRLGRLERTLAQRVIGQPVALHAITQALQVSLLGARNPQRPRAVLLLAGPTGVGKTESAYAVAEALFPGKTGGTILRIDMNELHEIHDVAKLVGAAPGYVGYQDEGQLTGWLRRHPFSVILLDEIDKAHPQVMTHLMDLFDSGQITDGQGRTVVGREAIYILTTNLLAEVGSDPNQTIPKVGFATRTPSQSLALEAQLRERLRATMLPEHVGRIDRIILYNALSQEHIVRIVQLRISQIEERIAAQGDLLEVTADAMQWLAERAYDPATGARAVAQVIERALEAPRIQQKLNLPEGEPANFRVDVAAGRLVFTRLP